MFHVPRAPDPALEARAKLRCRCDRCGGGNAPEGGLHPKHAQPITLVVREDPVNGWIERQDRDQDDDLSGAAVLEG